MKELEKMWKIKVAPVVVGTLSTVTSELEKLQQIPETSVWTSALLGN